VPEADLRQRVYNVRGELATISEAADVVRKILPDADLEVTEGGDLPWTQNLDMTAAQRDLGYEVAYDLETGFRSYIDTLREEHGLDPV
jgi:nucleoside-diphosphate-sugar epimerase